MSDVFGVNDKAEQIAAMVNGHLPPALESVTSIDLAQIGHRISALREELHTFFVRLRLDAEMGLELTEEDVDRAERRVGERMHGVYNAIMIADLTRRNEHLEREIEMLRNSKQQR